MSKLVNVDTVIDEIEKHKQYMRDKIPNEKLAELYFLAHEHIKELILLKVPSAEEESFEWCTDCKEYDQEQHCCHRYSKVIRQAFEEMKVVHCIDCQHSEYDEVYKDRYCHYNGKAEVVDDYHFCRDGEKKHDDVTCENCNYSEKYVDGLILCRRTKTSHRVSATSTCGKGKREVEEAEAKAIISSYGAPANIAEHIEAINVALRVLGGKATMAEIWAWAKQPEKEVNE